MAKKDNIIRRVEDIDEKELLASLAGFGEEKTSKPISPIVEENENSNQIESQIEEPEMPTQAPRKKQGGNYKSAFLISKELKNRQCVYIGADLHEKILAIVKEIADKSMTVGAFVDTILRQHLEDHKDEINNLYRRKRDNLL